MSITPMMISNDYFPSLTRSISILFFICCLMSSLVQAQNTVSHLKFVPDHTYFSQDSANPTAEVFPNPKKVMYRSLMVPGWGQVTNKQAWKVPLVYGLLGGLTYYSVYLHKKYHDYRAAYYNSVEGVDSDFRFGPTPSYIPENASSEALRSNRNFFRNRRDFVYISIGLAYGLNVIDAYVFAHLRSFDVSDDLSMNATIKPSVINTSLQGVAPSVSISIQLINK